MFFYGHPQNRFWKVVSGLLGERLPSTIEEKRDFLLRNHIAAWDVIKSCQIKGSSDSSIRDVVPNDFTPILKAADIRHIYVNGATAEKYYKKYVEAKLGVPCICLPSTSPANARYDLEDLMKSWSVILDDLA